MKIRLMLLLAASWCAVLSGCDTRVHAYELKKVQDICSTHGGIFTIHSQTDGSVGVRCVNGHFEWVKR
jgi:hypothetical protein